MRLTLATPNLATSVSRPSMIEACALSASMRTASEALCSVLIAMLDALCQFGGLAGVAGRGHLQQQLFGFGRDAQFLDEGVQRGARDPFLAARQRLELLV